MIQHADKTLKHIQETWTAPPDKTIDIRDAIVELEADLGVKLMARFIGDAVDGSVTVVGGREVYVVLYDEDRDPTPNCESPLRRCTPATQAKLKDCIAPCCTRAAKQLKTVQVIEVK